MSFQRTLLVFFGVYFIQAENQFFFHLFNL